MHAEGFNALVRSAELIEQRSAQVPMANRYVEYWHGAAFEVLGVRCVASMRDTRKIVDLTPAIRIPGVKSWVRGLANIGGRILSIADLSAYLSNGDKASTGKQAMVVSGRGIHTGLVIDASFGGVRFPVDALRSDQSVPEQLQPYISGVFTADDGDYAVFSIDRLLNDADFAEAGIYQRGD